MGKLTFDWLERHRFNKKYEQVFIVYTSYTRTRIKSLNNGIILGYSTKDGLPFFEMRFREAMDKEKIGQDIWVHHKSLIGFFDKAFPYITSPPLILLSSKKAVDWLQRSAYKWKSISEKSKSRLFFWVQTLSPEFEHYDATTQPFSVLRELCLEENKNLAKKIASKEFYDYSLWNE